VLLCSASAILDCVADTRQPLAAMQAEHEQVATLAQLVADDLAAQLRVAYPASLSRQASASKRAAATEHAWSPADRLHVLDDKRALRKRFSGIGEVDRFLFPPLERPRKQVHHSNP
jgi:hypothetical protein